MIKTRPILTIRAGDHNTTDPVDDPKDPGYGDHNTTDPYDPNKDDHNTTDPELIPIIRIRYPFLSLN